MSTPPSRPFSPAPWAGGAHAQTIIARALRPKQSPLVERERCETPDGDFLDIDWSPDPGESAPVVLILHGLEGSSKRGYVVSLALELLRRGIRPAALNFRGCSGEPNRTRRFYHSGETQDPAWALARIRDRYPDRKVAAMGFSLGGNVLLKLIGERPDGGTSTLDAAAVMSVPFDLAAGCAHLGSSPMGRAYSSYFMRSLKRKVELKRELLRDVIDVDRAAETRSIWDFDEVVTAPLGGFRDAAHYYRESSCSQYIGGIRVPTLVVHASDDPFLPSDAIPVRAASENPHVTLELQDRGGHVGFLSGSPWKPHFWAEDVIASFLAEALESRSKGKAATAG